MLKRYLFVSAIVVSIVVFWALPALAEMIVDTAWVRRYNGTGNSYDRATALAVDDSGNVYVTGQSWGGVTGYDYATMKYHPNGDTAWSRRYNSSGNSDDYAYAIVVDYSGNVCVTGTSGSMKYDANGNLLWISSWSGVDMVTDESNNLYITGGSSDYITVKFYPNGDTAWVRRYNGTGNGSDYASAIAIDGYDNAYVTGYSWGSDTSYDFVTIKYYPNGDTVWIRRYTEPDKYSAMAYAIAIDSSGNVFVSGCSYGSGSYSDYTILKYYPNGDTAWTRKYNGPGNDEDKAHAIAVDASGNACVTGYVKGAGGLWDYDYATIKYDPSGNELWVRRYDGPENNYDEAFDIAIDDSSNVYVTGCSYDNLTRYDYITIKYYPNGDTAWIRRYDGPDNIDDYAVDITVDVSGNVYVTGYSDDLTTHYDYATIKYLPTGRFRGDANGNGLVEVGDVLFLINYLYRGSTAPDPLEIGDVNCDWTVDVGDVLFLINYLFKSGKAPDCYKTSPP